MNLISSYLVGKYYTSVKTRLASNKLDARRRLFAYNKDFLSLEQSHRFIESKLLSDEPTMVARYGTNEAQIVGKYFMRKKHLLKDYGTIGNMLYNTSGFFSKNNIRNQEDLDRFAELMVEDSKQCDLIGASHVLLEDYVINNCCKNSEITEFNNLRIMVCEESWGKALEGKKVLVIHPFEETIKSQYARREKIWSNPTILPEFELITYKAVQTIGGINADKYGDWFAALELMKNDIRKIDFDIAILGCGAYGFPLAAEIKRMGKKAVHLGGQAQMVFGILGKRWEEIPYYKQFINEYWVRPSQDEKPENFKSIENGCYW